MALEPPEALAEVESPAMDLPSAGSNMETTVSRPQEKSAVVANANANANVNVNANANAIIGISGKGKKRKRAFSGEARSKSTIFYGVVSQ
jgi:hypothetical protein